MLAVGTKNCGYNMTFVVNRLLHGHRGYFLGLAKGTIRTKRKRGICCSHGGVVNFDRRYMGFHGKAKDLHNEEKVRVF